MESLKNVVDYWCGDYSKAIIGAEDIFNEIYKNCNYTFDKNCGSYLFNGQNYEYFIDLYPKQKLLYDIAKNNESVLEIGTYMGHSALIMLLANPKLKITTVDIMNHLSAPAVDTLIKYFPDAEIEFIHGSSLDVIPKLDKKYDLFHIDGNHDADFVIKEFDQCKNLSNSNIYKVIFDDWHGERGPGSLVESHVLKNNVKQYIIPDCLWTNSYFEIEL